MLRLGRSYHSLRNVVSRIQMVNVCATYTIQPTLSFFLCFFYYFTKPKAFTKVFSKNLAFWKMKIF